MGLLTLYLLYRPFTVFTIRGSCPDMRKTLSLLRNRPDDPGFHAVSYSMAIRIVSPGLKRSAREVTTYLHLVPKLRMNGVMTLLPPIRPWRGQGKTLLFLYLFWDFEWFTDSFRLLLHQIHYIWISYLLECVNLLLKQINKCRINYFLIKGLEQGFRSSWYRGRNTLAAMFWHHTQSEFNPPHPYVRSPFPSVAIPN
jgi:hypothetical protein